MSTSPNNSDALRAAVAESFRAIAEDGEGVTGRDLVVAVAHVALMTLALELTPEDAVRLVVMVTQTAAKAHEDGEIDVTTLRRGDLQ